MVYEEKNTNPFVNEDEEVGEVEELLDDDGDIEEGGDDNNIGDIDSEEGDDVDTSL
jgi:hypothetical protein